MLLAASGARAGDRPEEPVGDRHGLQVIRAWDEPIGPSAAGRKRHIELVFDHREGVVRRRVRDESGRLTSDATVIGYPRPSPEEIEQAFDVVRNDPGLGRLLRRSGSRLDGGFLLVEGPDQRCGPGSRCLQVFMLSGRDLIRRTIVDLARGRIAYPSYPQ